MIVSFDPDRPVIVLEAEIYGPAGSVQALLALDTGATTTVVSNWLLTAIGYDLSLVQQRITIITGSGTESVREVVVEKIQAIDQAVEDVTVICHDLPEETDLDGLLGLNFLRHLDIQINYSTSTLALSPLSS